jgi:hypothetical protein
MLCAHFDYISGRAAQVQVLFAARRSYTPSLRNVALRPEKALKTLSFRGFIFCLLRSFFEGCYAICYADCVTPAFLYLGTTQLFHLIKKVMI